MSEELGLVKEVASRLERAGLEYMMTGSMAMAAYSIPRMTRDIDIVLQAGPRDVGEIVAMFQADFYVDEESVREAVLAKDMFNIIHNDSVIKVDFVVRKDDEYRIEEFSRRRKVNIQGAAVSVVAREDLVLSKLAWARQAGESELQLRDVRQMLAAFPDLDQRYLQKWADALGVADLLRKAAGHA